MTTRSSALIRSLLTLFVVGTWSCPAHAADKVMLSDKFDTNSNNYASVTPWQAKYCADQWTTSLNGGITPKTDHGCSCNANCDFAVYTQGGNTCVNSQATDNMIVRGDLAWQNYTFRVRLRNQDNDTLGVVFRYQNTANYYLVVLSRDIGPSTSACDTTSVGARLIRVQSNSGAGKATVLATSKSTYQIGKVHLLQVTVLGDQITVHLDSNSDGKLSAVGELLFSTKDTAHKAGKIGLYAYQNGAAESPCNQGGCWFDDVLVTELSDPAVQPPIEPDGDKDGIADKSDNCPTVPNSKQANKDGDKFGDACDDDADGDGIKNVDEAKVGAQPLDRDSDDDGVEDGKEAQPLEDTDGDGIPNIMDPDSDNDGLNDGLEVGVSKPAADTDVTKGNFVSDQDPISHTSMVKADTDGDGRSDGTEDANGNGRVDKCESDPLQKDTPPCDNAGNNRGVGGDQDAGAAGSGDGGGPTDVAGVSDAGVVGGNGGGTGAVQLKTVGEPEGGCRAAAVSPDRSLVWLVLLAFGALWIRRRSPLSSP